VREAGISSSLDRAGIRAVQVVAVGLGVLALLLDVTGWLLLFGGLVAVIGALNAFLCPRGWIRTVALAMNGLALAFPAVLLLIAAAYRATHG
jgi:hypothetical protein